MADLYTIVCAPLGMVGMKGGAILCAPLRMIGNADDARSYRQFGVPLSVILGTPMQGGVIANAVYPSRHGWGRR